MQPEPPPLEKYPFTVDHLPAVEGFFCGSEEWERELSEWIQNPGEGGALHDVRARDCQVWLYYTERDGVIGFGSLGTTEWHWPTRKGHKRRLASLPMVAVRRDMWGKPDGPPNRRWSSLILDDLIEEAFALVERTGCEPVLGLWVDERNTRAIKFYSENDFRMYAIRRKVSEPDRWLQTMYLDLTPELPTEG